MRGHQHAQWSNACTPTSAITDDHGCVGPTLTSGHPTYDVPEHQGPKGPGPGQMNNRPWDTRFGDGKGTCETSGAHQTPPHAETKAGASTPLVSRTLVFQKAPAHGATRYKWLWENTHPRLARKVCVSMLGAASTASRASGRGPRAILGPNVTPTFRSQLLSNITRPPLGGYLQARTKQRLHTNIRGNGFSRVCWLYASAGLFHGSGPGDLRAQKARPLENRPVPVAARVRAPPPPVSAHQGYTTME